jgi:hypothetical protein
MYGMQKTTLYLPEDLKRELERVAGAHACSEAEVIREALRAFVADARPAPRLPLFASGQPGLAARADDLLAGFGER